ncbi:hemerythrin domain-containing protein [Pseudonocardia sp. T1-2H]|uniref:hemerythrin domain-containing protein n=1 Tax=Pseudonocardia sp. T1-2H TaxID=3128899 RepID=UPI00310141DD
MADITQLILDDHQWFRQQFADLDELRAQTPMDADAVRRVWDPLADRLDVHAVAEEEIFYPQLLAKGQNDPDEETLDAIGDHNDIRDGVHDAARHPVASRAWWEAADRAREANDEHMAEEENEGLKDFRLHAPRVLRESLGKQFADFLERHRGSAGISTADKDPEEYVRTIEAELNPPSDAGPAVGLGIGSLRNT